MSSSLYKSTWLISSFEYHAGPKSISFNGEFLPFLHPNISDFNKGFLNDIYMTEELKVFVPCHGGPWHFFNDTVGAFLSQLEKTPDAKFIFDVTLINKANQDTYYDYFFEKLAKKGIKFDKYNHESGTQGLNAKNFLTLQHQVPINDEPNRVYDFFLSSIDDLNIKPYIKAYMSRKKYHKTIDLFNVHPGTVGHDNRILNEELLEDFLITKGYQIVVPDDFVTFEDQINYMYQVKTLISVSGSGLTNMFFMQPKNTVIEIVTPLLSKWNADDSFGIGDTETIRSHANEEIHHYFTTAAFKKQHRYIGLPNHTREAEDIIKTYKEFIRG